MPLKSNLQVFGIRHHGPGSARRLVQALDAWQPDCILVEFPADGQRELEQVARLALEPPVALVMYGPDDMEGASYYPFARFSPEWQALQWAARQRVAVLAMDLPAGTMLAMRRGPQQLSTPAAATPTHVQQDPLGEIARLAGYDDREQWWELTFEQETDDFALFDAILTLIGALRADHEASREILLREAHMRKVLRSAMAAGHQRIAVVCGAWHAPALAEVARYKPAADNQALRGLPKSKINTAWIPWSYPRLAREGGYGAGVHSPAWYELRYDYGHDAPTHWMVKAAQLLRAEGMDTSPAHAQEGVRLAQALAAMNGRRMPKLDDLAAAALSTLCAGATERLVLIEQRLMLGEKVGTVPENASVVPLQKDLTQLLKTTRLNKYWAVVGEQWLKATATQPQGGIDLREPTDLMKSCLLYQLQILGIPWGTVQEGSANDLGGFKERWRLLWLPEFSLSVLEAAMWGNTVADAAENRLRQPQPDADLATLAQGVLLGLRAQLPQAVAALTTQLRDRSALTRDVRELLSGLPTLIRIIQYGDARKTDVTALAVLVAEITPRLAAGLAGAAAALDEEAATLLLHDLLAAHRGLCQLDLPLLDDHWWPALRRLADTPTTVPLVQGLAVRLLMDQHRLTPQAVAQRLDFALSAGNEPMEVAQWLAGFLHGSGLVLLHHPPLWSLVNNWVAATDMDTLENLLPLLRRTFAQFSPGERQRILQLAQTQPTLESTFPSAPATWDATRFQTLLDGVRGWV